MNEPFAAVYRGLTSEERSSITLDPKAVWFGHCHAPHERDEARAALAAQPGAVGEGATIAGLECAVGHLSAMVDEQRRLLVEVEQVYGRDAYGIEFEDGDSELIDKVRAHLAATTGPDAALASKEQP